MISVERQSNFILTVGRLIESRKKADPKTVWELAQNHINPGPFIEDFSGPELDLNRWPVTSINFNGGIAKPFISAESVAKISIADHCLHLGVGYDPGLCRKSHRWHKGQAAATQYNNAYLTGAEGFLPTPGQNILITAQMKVDRQYPGSAGIWLQDQDTFDPRTGEMNKPFRSAGFYFLGEKSTKFLRGLSLQTCLGMAPQEIVKIIDVDPHSWHEYQMLWYWQDNKHQAVKYSLDGQLLWVLPVKPFGPGEIQLWADNYLVTKLMQLRYLNPCRYFKSAFRRVRVEAVSL